MRKLAFITSLFMLFVCISMPYSSVHASGTDYFIPVPIITQGSYTNACWACCGASAVNYARGLNVAFTTFALNAGSDYYHSANFTTIQAGLFYYSLSYSYHSSSVSASSIKTNISYDRSLIAGWDYTNQAGNHAYGHVVLICGIDYGSTEKTVAYMDPRWSSYQYKDYSDFLQEYNRTWTQTISNIYYP